MEIESEKAKKTEREREGKLWGETPRGPNPQREGKWATNSGRTDVLCIQCVMHFRYTQKEKKKNRERKTSGLENVLLAVLSVCIYGDRLGLSKVFIYFFYLFVSPFCLFLFLSLFLLSFFSTWNVFFLIFFLVRFFSFSLSLQSLFFFFCFIFPSFRFSFLCFETFPFSFVFFLFLGSLLFSSCQNFSFVFSSCLLFFIILFFFLVSLRSFNLFFV